EAARGETALGSPALEQRANTAERRVGPQPGGPERAVEAALASQLPAASRDDPLANHGGGFPGRLGGKRLQRRPRHIDAQIDPVEERARESALVEVEHARRAAAAPQVVARPAARAGIGGSYQDEPGGVGHGARRAGDGDPALLQRLAEGLQRRRVELGELVEKEHAAAGSADLAGAGHAGAATDQARGGDAVVRAPERTRPAQWDPVELAQDAADPGHLHGLFQGQRRKDAGQAAREHRLARARWSTEEQV